MSEHIYDPASSGGAADFGSLHDPDAMDARPEAVTEEETEEQNREIPAELPVLPVRDVVVFNYMILPLFVGRERSIKAVESALANGRHIFICAQKNEGTEEPGLDDLQSTGTIAVILRLLKMPDNHLKVLVQGVSRGRIKRVAGTDPFMLAEVEAITEPEAAEESEVWVDTPELAARESLHREALMRTAREQSERILSLRGVATVEIMSVLNGVDDPGRLADLIAANMRMKTADAQAILDCLEPVRRLELVNAQLAKEAEVTELQARIQHNAREGMDKAQKDYFLREQMRAIRRELGEGISEEDDLDELAEALHKAKLPADARKEADKQLRRLSSMHQDSSEATVVRTYLEWMAELPWAKSSKDKYDIPRAKKVLDDDHLGLEKVKDRILEYLSVRKLNPKSRGPILCFVGPPGVGKTSLGRSIANALGRKFQRISLGGMRDEAEIRGHRRTYIGAMPGRIIQSIKQAGTRNPVIMLDELDKLGNDFRGDPSSALLEALDPEQNHAFSDHYLNLPFDLSRVLFLCTANQLDSIPPALRDRLEVISLPGYTQQEKLAIARRHLLPRQLKENGLKAGEVTMSDAMLERIIRGYTREAGLRNLEREIGSVCRKFARRKAEGKKGPFTLNTKRLNTFLGAPRFLDEEKEELLPGVALGLAWTPFGGEVLHIEVSTMKGKGALTITGQLGDVMQESAKAAVSYLRHNAGQLPAGLSLKPDFAEKQDLHIHVPAGATPKDGPSAGVTIVAALVSALTGRAVRPDLAMTGEITLRGRVLPVGGIKEKILAAVTHGAKHVAIPEQNIKDLEEIPADLRRRIQIHPVRTLDDLLPLAFGEA